MAKSEYYMVEIVTKKDAKLIKRIRTPDIKTATEFAFLYINQHPQYDAHVHLTLGAISKEIPLGYVREKVIKGGN